MAFQVAHYVNDRTDLQPKPIRSEWILEGEPEARVYFGSESADHLTSGLWDCTAGRFRWVYGSDEIVHIVEGAVLLEDQNGQTLELRPGSVVHFKPGDEVIWTVPEYVKKFWVDRYPKPSFLARVRGYVERRRAGGDVERPGAL